MNDDLIIIGAVFLGTVVLMEGVAWSMHRYLMHGPLWFIHRSHHERHDGWFELNDVFGLVFASASVALIHLGGQGRPALLGAGIGLLGYGLIYFLLHDVLVHRRVPHRFRPKQGYLARVVQAHNMHHATRGREGAVSFGFAYAENPARLREQLRANRAALEADGAAAGRESGV